ncbi:MAG: hypothetical protein Q7T91_05210 [Sulfuricurvum sp.]|nr:hypothetical protein [Sulfuricurvum sp.]
MRVREMAFYIEQIDFEECALSVTNNTINNIIKYKKALDILENVSILQDDIREIVQGPLYSTPQDSLFISNDNIFRTVYRESKNILDKASLLLSLSNVLSPPLSENTISIKLPETKDMTSLLKNMKSFESSLSFLVQCSPINSTITVDNWEHGSFWLNLYAGSVLAVGVVSTAAWSAAVVSKKMAEAKYIEQQVRSLNIKNDSLADILEAQKKETDLLLENETRALIDSHLENHEDNEQFLRVKDSITILAELIQQGAEVNPALSAPEDVKNLFPDYSKLDQVSSKIKQIEYKVN